MIGETLLRYKVLQKLGQGGMGEVFLAFDTVLQRNVALKFLPESLQYDAIAQKRLLREARSAAVLDHPFICHVHEIAEVDGKSFIAMEYVEGQTLKDRMALGSMSDSEVLQAAIEITEALKLAHQHHIVHRDVKPGNIMITRDGHVKIMDFGLAKQIVSDEASNADTQSALTGRGVPIGTLAYMSPEQVRGEPASTQSDIFSLGLVLYQMITGVNPFQRNTAMETAKAILADEPAPISKYVKNHSNLLDTVVMKMLAKESSQRYQSAGEVLEALEKYRSWLNSRDSILRRILYTTRNPWFIVPALLAISLIGFWFFHRSQRINWAREKGLPEIARLIKMGDHSAAFTLAQEVAKYVPNDPLLLELWPRMSTRYSILTTPDAAEVSFRNYSDVKGEFKHLGRSPIHEIRFPIGAFRINVVKKGYQPVELICATPEARSWPVSTASDPFSVTSLQCNVHLDREDSIPPKMSRIQVLAKSVFVAPYGIKDIKEVPVFLMDRYEVTNAEFKKFVDGGGYRKKQYWKHPIQIDKRNVSWEEAMNHFRDKSGRLGPAEWEGGLFPNGQAEHPVSGVSWYEAAAYAEFMGNSLPTIHHWFSAAQPDKDALVVIPFSNFSGKGSAPAGSYPGIGQNGLYDMAGNIREWCSSAANQSGDLRYIQGGSWADPAYMFGNFVVQPSWDRSRVNGFRTVKYLEDRLSENLINPFILESPAEQPLAPVPDSEFEAYRKYLYSYDPTNLNASVESVNDSQLWRREKISFDAAYGNERITAYLFLPHGIKPPYQAVVYSPTSLAYYPIPSEKIGREQGMHDYLWEFLVLGGRAVLYPVYKGTYERQFPGKFPDSLPSPNNRIAYRDWHVQTVKDLNRSIDYLMTRNDIDKNKLAYYGASGGAYVGPICLALEKRLKLGVLLLGCFAEQDLPPETDPVNFMPRVQTPLLVICGEHELGSIASPKTLFDFFGTPQKDKVLRIHPGGHGMWGLFGHEVRKEILDWLDQHFGKVE